MCDACVIDEVKRSMLSRRGLLGLGAAAGAAAVMPAGAALAQTQTAAPAATREVRGTALADLTHTLDPEFPTFSGQQQFFMDQRYRVEKDGYNLFDLRIDEHTGTHMDAPLHFSPDGLSVDQLPVADLMAPLAIVDIRAKAAESADAQVTPDDIKAWVSANGELPERCVVAMNSGWAAHVGTPKFRNADASGTMHFPGFHPDVAAMLLEGSAVGIAVDSLSLDFGISADFATHMAWLSAGRWGLECCAGLDALPASGATIILGAPKHRGGTGGPARVFALV
ncbi:cyclase family protein [Antarcticirhabdus aurantiaca]|uniref:Cyclase family protein n=1 Tax=Antarcticirhabdus aurantiaca TaxID=2606717 RepID=A0ACD4NIV9_9HYPH|nr:cyclase family protein [Antarcticirhabdus aurantiaca]WAJ26772.1 cyclase family protein [Jeongeuplla avenae]